MALTSVFTICAIWHEAKNILIDELLRSFFKSTFSLLILDLWRPGNLNQKGKQIKKKRMPLPMPLIHHIHAST